MAGVWNVPVAFVSIVVSWLAAYSPGLTATPSTLKGSFVAPRADEKRRDDAQLQLGEDVGDVGLFEG